jgi:hypothetical protein
MQDRAKKAVAADVRRRNSIADRNPPPQVGGYGLELDLANFPP